MHELFTFAYIDPGTGSLIIQSLIGAVAGVALFGRRIFYSVKAKLTGKKTVDTTKAGTPTPTPVAGDKADSAIKTDDSAK